MTIAIAQDAFEIAGDKRKLRVAVYAPYRVEGGTWASRVRTGAPRERDKPTYGEGPLQALSLGLSTLAANLYSSAFWREGQLGWRGEFGGYLGLPAPTIYLDFAPFPFDLGTADLRDKLIAPAYGDPEPRVIVEETFAIVSPRGPLQVRLFKPEESDGGIWRCRVQIDPPIDVDHYATGHSSLEALWRAVCLVGEKLYSSPLWRSGHLGPPDDPGGFMGAPPPSSLSYLTKHSF